MPFIGLNRHTKERICILDVVNPRLNLKSGDYVCQSCETPLIITGAFMRGDSYVRAHFRHKTPCDGNYDSHIESAEHLALKRYIAENVHNWYGVQKNDITVQYEYPISMDWRERGRIADVMVEFNDTKIKDIHEIQLSSITVNEFQERTNDYLKSGYFVWWYIGEKNAKPEIFDYLKEHQECAFLVDAKPDKHNTIG